MRAAARIINTATSARSCAAMKDAGRASIALLVRSSATAPINATASIRWASTSTKTTTATTHCAQQQQHQQMNQLSSIRTANSVSNLFKIASSTTTAGFSAKLSEIVAPFSSANQTSLAISNALRKMVAGFLLSAALMDDGG
eukprot:GEZU01013397.1.p1 GENE.GEZU01013397.1~~GEZU01013397.1.p1  ORF type:complete len:142 (+),score=30.51 GEZU01013397.1:118-543(+)